MRELRGCIEDLSVTSFNCKRSAPGWKTFRGRWTRTGRCRRSNSVRRADKKIPIAEGPWSL